MLWESAEKGSSTKNKFSHANLCLRPKVCRGLERWKVESRNDYTIEDIFALPEGVRAELEVPEKML